MKIDKEDRSNKYNPVHKKMHELWRSMMNRCYSDKSGSYKNYGAIGVTVCEKWKKYDGFLDDIDKVDGFEIIKYKYATTIERQLINYGIISETK